MLHSGIKIGEYTLVEKLGSGGFGDVWKAEKRTALDVNWFALKFFRPKEDGIEFDKVGRELAVWKQLRGLPHIISVIELDRFDDYVYVVSDFADGGSLESWLRNNGGKAPNHETAVRIALEILTGLENLHEKGFVHRDLKPDNVLIMNGKHCLADFGISREIKTHSKATGTAGTLEYMPPEAFEKTPSVTPATDIWAVGVILQRLLTGKLPFPQDDQPSLMFAILMSEPDPMSPDVPERLRAIVSKALKKNRAERFASAAEMRGELAGAIRPTEAPAAKKPASTIVDEDFDRAQKAEEEQWKWEASVALNRKSTYQSYLSDYPTGKYASQAKLRIKEFEDSEKAEGKAREAEAQNAKRDEAKRKRRDDDNPAKIIARVIEDERIESTARQTITITFIALFVSTFAVGIFDLDFYSTSIIGAKIVLLFLSVVGLIVLFTRLREAMLKYTFNGKQLDTIGAELEPESKPFSRNLAIAVLVLGLGATLMVGITLGNYLESLFPRGSTVLYGGPIHLGELLCPPIFVLFADLMRILVSQAIEKLAAVRGRKEIRSVKAGAAVFPVAEASPKINRLVLIVGIPAGILTLIVLIAVGSGLLRASGEDWANGTSGEVRKNRIGMDLVFVPSGDFLMGSDKSEDEKPVRKVMISKGFWMGKFEVTQAQWAAVMGLNPSKDTSYRCTACPVDNVSWNDAVEFISRLNGQDDGLKYSLPSEAEWEYAARGLTTGDYYGPVDEIGWYSVNSGSKTHPVGEKQPNSFGLYDMSGNVSEWVQDIYNNTYTGLPTDGSVNLTVGNKNVRVLRGGSWLGSALDLRSAERNGSSPSYRNSNFGFRVLARPR